MASVVRLVALGALAGLALLGLALGAESQKEFVLESDLAAQGKLASSGAAGNLILLTGLLVAIGATGCLLLLSRLRVRDRLRPAVAFAVATYGGVLLGQTMWPYYVALAEDRYANLATSLIAANLPAVPSLLVAPMALMLAAILVAGAAAARLLSKVGAPDAVSPERLLRAQGSAALLAVPFLALTAWGNVRLLLALPDDAPGLGPYFVVLPVVALGCLALIGIALAKTWHLGSYVRNARLAGAVQDTWHTLGRVETAVLAVLGALAFAGTFLQAADLPQLHSGLVLGVTLRGHTQMLVFLAAPMAPLLALHRVVGRVLEGPPRHPATLDDGTHPVARAVVAGGLASAGLAGVATLAALAGPGPDPPALWAWLLALLPAAAVAAVMAGPRLSAPLVLLGAFTLWAIGNTVQATYDAREGSNVLAFVTPPGLLALWRTLGALAAATALTRLARGLGDGRFARLPLAAGAGLATSAVALLEMPLTAWLINRPGVDAIAVGSVVASLDPPVRAILHTVAAVLAVAAATLVALLHRPDWFTRPPRRPVAVVRAKRAGDAAKTPA